MLAKKESLIHKKVFFQDKIYWLHEVRTNNLSSFYHLSPLEHYDEKGKLTPIAFDKESHAVVLNGKIFRLGKVIGYQVELIELNENLQEEKYND